MTEQKKRSLCFIVEKGLEGNNIFSREYKEVAADLYGEMTVVLNIMNNYRAITFQLH